MSQTVYSDGHWTDVEPTEEVLAQYASNNETAYNRAKVEIFERLLPGDLHGRRLLDYGGGGGWMAVRCATKGARVTLVDAAANALRLSRRLAESQGVAELVETVRADAVPSGLRAQGFDVVIAKDIVEHIPDDGAFLADLAACQPPGGLLLLSTQNSQSLNYLIEGTYRRWWCGEKDWCGWDPTHVRFYTPASLQRRLEQAGYRPTRWWGLYIIPYNILSWLLLLRRDVVLDGLHHFDLRFGAWFPLNHWGWNVIVAAERVS